MDNPPLIRGRDVLPNKVKDMRGRTITAGMRVRFYPQTKNDGVWDANTEIEDGCLTVSILNVSCVRNPEGWDMPHEWTKSRWWSTAVGYGEWGAWNCPRVPISQFGFLRNKKQWKRRAAKHGYGDRYINARVLGQAIRLPVS